MAEQPTGTMTFLFTDVEDPIGAAVSGVLAGGERRTAPGHVVIE